MGNQLCTATEETQFKKRMAEICHAEENKKANSKLQPITFSDNGRSNEMIHHQDNIQQHSIENYQATKSQTHQFIIKQDLTPRIKKEQSSQTMQSIDPAQIHPQVSEKYASSPMKRAKLDLNQLYMKHVNLNEEEGNLKYQPISVPFSVIKMVLSKQLIKVLHQEKKDLEKLGKDQSSFKLYKAGFYGHVFNENQGIFINKDYFYEGFFVQKEKGQFKPHNQGTYITQVGKYVGNFIEGKPHGRGKYLEFSSEDSKKNTIYEGQWHDGSLTKGIVENHFFQYQGNLKNSKPHGSGKLNLKESKSTYAGDFKEGRFHGVSSIYETSSHTYSGDFQNGRKNGRGILLQKATSLRNHKGQTKKQEIYQGVWRQDRLEGQVVLPAKN